MKRCANEKCHSGWQKKTADKITKQVQITLRKQFTVKSNGTDVWVTESLKYKTA